MDMSPVPQVRTNRLVRHSERGKKTKKTKKRKKKTVKRHQRMDRPGGSQVTEGNRERGKMEETGCEVICGALKTLAVKG